MTAVVLAILDCGVKCRDDGRGAGDTGLRCQVPGRPVVDLYYAINLYCLRVFRFVLLFVFFLWFQWLGCFGYLFAALVAYAFIEDPEDRFLAEILPGLILIDNLGLFQTGCVLIFY